MTRGIITIYWGDKENLPIGRLKKSVENFHPELPFKIIQIEASPKDPFSLNRKAEMFDLSPFDETLFLDADTVVMGNLNFGFEKASEFGLALSICESPWGRRYPKIFTGDQIEYNTGVIFYTKKAEAVFSAWRDMASEVDSAIIAIDESGHAYTMPANDQGSFALAIERTGFNPFVLPLNWNFRPKWQPSFFGPIKIWHDYTDPPIFFKEMNEYYLSPDSIIQYHPA